ncbi:MAG TPA: ROK family protein [Candidatus Nanoarchaeia archaeon]|nr:ROK family protein [Candidatus Nanoarchaeia archaeon]
MKRNFCIDIGGSAIKYSFISKEKIQGYCEIKTPKKKQDFLKTILQIIKTNVNNTDNICISIASPILSGVVQSPPNLPIEDFNFPKFINKKFKNKVYIENDARCAALAENKINKHNDFVLLTLGTGVGGAVFLSGKLYKGEGYAGELGHVIVENDYFENLWKTRINTIRYLSEAIISIQNSLDPKLIIISTRVIKDKKEFLEKLSSSLNKDKFNKLKPKIIFSKIKNPELIGASLLPNMK